VVAFLIPSLEARGVSLHCAPKEQHKREVTGCGMRGVAELAQ
jgi:hypothetical protein